GLAVLLGLAYAAPIAIGLSSPIHLLIAGFAIYEAWKLNRGMALRVTGPYQVAPRAAPAWRHPMAAPALCVQCGTHFAPTRLAFRSCHPLLSAKESNRLATTA